MSAISPNFSSGRILALNRAVLLQHRSNMEAIAFPEGAIDLDTPTDYEQFISTRFLN